MEPKNKVPTKRKFWLYANLMYDIKHIREVTWWRRLFGKGSLWLAECEAVSDEVAAKKFKVMGYRLGYYSQYK